MNDVTAIIPVKPRISCKTRLAEYLTASQRLSLVRDMLQHVVSTLQQSPVIKRIVVLTSERDRVPAGIETLNDDGQDLNRCLTNAVATLRQQGCSRLLILPADLPNLTVDDVYRLTETEGLSIAPSSDELGTNALCLPKNMPFEFRFGDNSFYTHCHLMNTSGVDYRIVRSPGLAFDVDTPKDYLHYQSRVQQKLMRSVAV